MRIKNWISTDRYDVRFVFSPFWFLVSAQRLPSTQEVLDDLAANETLAYIVSLENEVERLRKQMKEINNQLQSSKVSFLLL